MSTQSDYQRHLILKNGKGTETVHVEAMVPVPYCEQENRLRIVDTNHQPSWRNGGTGNSCFEITAHRKAKHFTIVASETPEGGRGGKETYTSLTTEAARELLKFLQVTLGDEQT